jgi:hypothetical protein
MLPLVFLLQLRAFLQTALAIHGATGERPHVKRQPRPQGPSAAASAQLSFFCVQVSPSPIHPLFPFLNGRTPQYLPKTRRSYVSEQGLGLLPVESAKPNHVIGHTFY